VNIKLTGRPCHQKVREVEVLKAARDGSSSALLVYANETSIQLKPSDLPSQLQVGFNSHV